MQSQDQSHEASAASALGLAVIMERKVLANKWLAEQWEAIGIVPDRAQSGAAPRCIRDAPGSSQWLYPGYQLQLCPDDAENYLLNVTAPEPRVFVMWQMEEGGARPRPLVVTVSYGKAASMMDSGEQVDGVAMPADIRAWVLDFARAHYRPPEKRKGGRYASQKLGR